VTAHTPKTSLVDGTQPAFRRIGVLAHPNRPLTAPVAERIAQSLLARGVDHWLATRWTEADIHERVAHSDLLVAIGGDGAMLRAARVGAQHEVPVLGVNMGYLGFLTEIHDPDEWDNAVDPLLQGRGWVERRMMIEVTVQRAVSRDQPPCAPSVALNDAVISRGNVTRMIRLPTYIDGLWTTTYNADALIISTATGSTAYALATGGPILPPELRNILMVPVAPHLSLDRPIVLPEGAKIEVNVSSDMESDPVLSVDGTRLCALSPGDSIRIQASDLSAQFIRLRDRNYFYRSLLDRLEPRVTAPTQT